MTALGDFSSGDVLTAADLNAIGVLTDYTPNFSPGSGTWTSVFTSYARYAKVNSIVFGVARLYINNAGTGSNGVLFNLPVAADTGFLGIGNGRETAISGLQFHAYVVNPTTGGLRYYDNSDTANSSGRDFHFNFMYRAG